MSYISAAGAPTFHCQGNTLTKLIAPSTGAQEVMAWRDRLEPGAGSAPHLHDHEELIVVITGECVARIGRMEMILTVGDACLIPAGATHQITNRGIEPWECITVMPVGTQFLLPDGSETPPPPWTL